MAAEDHVILRTPPRIAAVIKAAEDGSRKANISLEALDEENFLLHVDSETLSAKLVRLPTIVDTARVCDNATYFKSGQVSHVLFAYEPVARVAGVPDPRLDDVSMLLQMVADPTPGPQRELVAASGLTPPSSNIVSRRFARALKFIHKYTREEIAEGERVILELMARDTYEHVIEELVDAEAFMAPWFAHGGDNVTLEYVDGRLADVYQLQHPEGTHVTYLKSTKATAVAPKIVRPNPDGTFGDAISIDFSLTHTHTHTDGRGMSRRGRPSRYGVAHLGATAPSTAAAASAPTALPGALDPFAPAAFPGGLIADLDAARPEVLPGLDDDGDVGGGTFDLPDDFEGFGSFGTDGFGGDFLASVPAAAASEPSATSRDVHSSIAEAVNSAAASVTGPDSDVMDTDEAPPSSAAAAPDASSVAPGDIYTGSASEPVVIDVDARFAASAEGAALLEQQTDVEARLAKARDEEASAQKQLDAATFQVMRTRWQGVLTQKTRNREALEKELADVMQRIAAAKAAFATS